MHIERQVREKQLNVFSPQFREFQRKEMCPMCQVPLLSINPLLQLLVKLFFLLIFQKQYRIVHKMFAECASTEFVPGEIVVFKSLSSAESSWISQVGSSELHQHLYNTVTLESHSWKASSSADSVHNTVSC